MHIVHSIKYSIVVDQRWGIASKYTLIVPRTVRIILCSPSFNCDITAIMSIIIIHNSKIGIGYACFIQIFFARFKIEFKFEEIC